MINTIFLDMDDTLLNNSHKISEKSKNFLINFQKNGVKVILISGRNLSGMIEYAKEIELDKFNGYFGCFNGAIIYKFENFKLTKIREKILDKNELLEVNKYVKTNDLSMMCYYDKDIYIENNNEYSVYENMLRDVVIYSMYDISQKIKEKNICKAVILANPDFSKNIVLELNSKFNKFEFYLSRNCYIECTLNGTNKGEFFNFMLKTLNIKNENAIAFGDSHNDFKMLKNAKNSVAMINAKDEIKKICKYQTKFSNNEDGVIEFLKKINIL